MSRELDIQTRAWEDVAKAAQDVAIVHRWFAEEFIARMERITQAIERAAQERA